MGRNEAYADEVYQPQDDGALDHTGELDMDDALDEPNADAILDAGYSPPEKPRVCGKFGTTESEQRNGESLEQRMAQEEPENWEKVLEEDLDEDGVRARGDELDDEVGYRRAGRLAWSDEDGEHWDVVGRDVGVDGGAASAEEAAMHIIDANAMW